MLTISIQPTKRQMIGLVSAALALSLVGVFIAPMAFARVTYNTIGPVAIVTDNGRHILVTGPIECNEGERSELRVTVTQRPTGAVAEGRAFIICTGNLQQWEVVVATGGKETFQEGPATAVGLARTTAHGDTTDAHQWLVNVTLVKE